MLVFVGGGVEGLAAFAVVAVEGDGFESQFPGFEVDFFDAVDGGCFAEPEVKVHGVLAALAGAALDVPHDFVLADVDRRSRADGRPVGEHVADGAHLQPVSCVVGGVLKEAIGGEVLVPVVVVVGDRRTPAVFSSDSSMIDVEIENPNSKANATAVAEAMTTVRWLA